MVVNSNTGVDSCILRHQVTDFQQDVTCIPAGHSAWEYGEGRKDQKSTLIQGTIYSSVKTCLAPS